MGQEFKLLPVYDPQAIINLFGYIKDGIEAILQNSGTDTSLEKVFNDLLAGRLLLWVGFLDGQYVGFVTTNISEIPGCPKTLWIVHAYKKKKVDSSWLLMGLEILEKFAIQQGCKAVKFYAIPKPWQDKFIKLGYKPGYIEYIKKLGEEHENL